MRKLFILIHALFAWTPGKNVKTAILCLDEKHRRDVRLYFPIR